MQINKIEIDGFRCLLDFKISFERDLTVIVGENDSGKTSLIECLKVITQNKKVEADDFNHNKNTIVLKIEIDDYIFEKRYIKDAGLVTEELFVAKPTLSYIDKIRDIIQDGTDEVEIKNIARTFGLTVRANSRIETLKELILHQINIPDGEQVEITNTTFPSFSNIQLDGTQFENVSGFFKEVFLKEKQANIWSEKIDGEQTIEEFVKSRISDYTTEITEKIIDKGILEKMQLYLTDLTDIKIEPLYQSRDLNIDAKVVFLENGKEINLEKKGDGTKRRVTMALLEFKKDESIQEDENTLYLLDEPDTHLHVKAQLELLSTMEKFASDGNQVILSTHSPFIINALHPRQIRLLQNSNNVTKVRSLTCNINSSNYLLRSLGVENTYLFFSRHIIIVEGETEEAFIPAYYMKNKGKIITSDLIKVINTKGINNVVGFCTAILELHDSERIYLVVDNDASPELEILINNLNIPDERKFVIGEKEFEDAFDSKAIHSCWDKHLIECGKASPESWSEENIEQMKLACLANGDKFSREIKSLNNASGKKMTKPILGRVLGEHIRDTDVPAQLLSLFNAVE